MNNAEKWIHKVTWQKNKDVGRVSQDMRIQMKSAFLRLIIHTLNKNLPERARIDTRQKIFSLKNPPRCDGMFHLLVRTATHPDSIEELFSRLLCIWKNGRVKNPRIENSRRKFGAASRDLRGQP
jgi:hypothetical protein